MSESRSVLAMISIPRGEKVCSLNTRGASSGLVSACEKASTPTIRPISDGSTEFGARVLGEQAGEELDPVDVAVEVAQAFLEAGSPEIWSKSVTRGNLASSR